MTLGDKIRGLKAEWGVGGGAAIDQAAALADEHAATIAKPSWDQIKHLYPDEFKATIAAVYEAAADTAIQHISKIQVNEPLWHEGQDWAADRISQAIRALAATDPDGSAALNRIKAEAVKEAFSDFTKADWFWRDLDPDDSGDTPDEAINRGMVGRFTVCHIRSSFTGPDRFCFIAPVLDPESDDEECLCFETEDEAIAAARERSAILTAAGEAGNG